MTIEMGKQNMKNQYSDEYEEDFEEGTSADESDEYSSDYDEDESDEYSEEYDDDEEYESSEDNSAKKKILIVGIVVVLLIILAGGGFIGLKIMKKNTAKMAASIESINSPDDSAIENNIAEKQETVVDENGNELTVIDIENEESSEPKEAESPVLPGEETSAAKDDNAVVDKSNLEIDDGSKLKEKNDDGVVDIAIGDIGRKNPFAPSTVKSPEAKLRENISREANLGFEIIEPPAFSESNSIFTKLLGTRVTGIMYDPKSPSAIINVDGFDQFVKIGDELEGFRIIGITKNRVIIQSDANIYKASVGQPLNSEKVVNSTELSLIKNKFYGSRQK